jgi:hypothetical protein
MMASTFLANLTLENAMLCLSAWYARRWTIESWHRVLKSSYAARWYVAHSLSLRDLKEMMAVHSLAVDHPTVRRWVCYHVDQLVESGKFRLVLSKASDEAIQNRHCR